MPSMLAYLPPDGLALTPGEVVPIERYLTEDHRFSPLLDGGALYLVTEVGGTPWLVAVLEAPERSQIKRGDRRPHGWYAPANVAPVVDLGPLRAALKLGAGSLADLLARPRRLTRSVEQQLRALFDAVDEPVVGSLPKARAAALDPALPVFERAAQALAAGDVAAAIAALAEAWRATRSVEVADLIDRATRRLPSWDRPLASEDKVWREAWSRDRDASLPPLVRNVFAGEKRAFPKRLEALLAAPDDPRIARGLAQQVHVPMAGELLAQYASLVERAREPRAWEAIADALPGLERTSMYVYRPGELDRLRFATGWQDLAPVSLAPEDAARVRAIEAELARLEADPTERDLVDAIADQPGDEQPVLVYADWLLDRGHPRGEYLALLLQHQRTGLTPASARRFHALEDLTFLYWPLDQLATRWRRARELGIDRTLDVYWTAAELTWREASHHPLLRALHTLRFVGDERHERIPAIAAFVRGAPRLARIVDLEPRGAKLLARELGEGWSATPDAVVRATPGDPPPRPSRARGTSARR